MIERQHQHETYEEFVAEMQKLTSMFTDEQILRRLATDYYTLTRNGWDNNPKYDFDHDCVDEIRACMVWIAENTRKTKTIRHTFGSYAYKHFVERMYQSEGHYHPYISNGCFIAAAIMQGYRFERDGKLNCDFNMAMPLFMLRRMRGY
jgi:hypothetical protein